MAKEINCINFTTSIAKPDVAMFDTGGSHVCAVFSGGRVACRGNDARKQLGLSESQGDGMVGFDGP